VKNTKDLKEKIFAVFVLLVVSVGILTVGYILIELIKETFDMLKNIFY
jgi:ABC-type phosphate transport system permease subunit